MVILLAAGLWLRSRTENEAVVDCGETFDGE